ncbi:glycosyl hydrolase family 18 protein [Motilimonas pumila]|uniref:GH18 domain-containing protein n=1 Tax=Motilimonas pumila TaxID=2303987 RepID=A0A418YH70_9GAMM|nr:glycosyl hydrolase family 18 protein [Motilimonas pumila]RJG49451.1 hypothetical protein D1Z90_05705 [Motilimonas pumila]
MLQRLIFLASAWLLSSIHVAAANEQFKVVGYLPSWQGSLDAVQYDKLTHLNYAFVLPNSDGTLQPISQPQRLIEMVSRAHSAGKLAGVAIGGWNQGNDSAFETLAASASSRQVFVDQVLALVHRYDLDGIDLDWEYPDPGVSSANYTLLVHALNQALKPHNKYLSAAVIAYGPTAAGIAKEALPHIDFFNLMAYDANDHHHSSMEIAQASLNYWSQRGVEPSKLVLGVPLYARPSWQSYNDIIAANPAAACHDEINGNFYNGLTTIRKKTALAQAKGGGIMLWELSQDAQTEWSLLSAIHAELNQQPNSLCESNDSLILFAPTTAPSIPPQEARWQSNEVYIGGDRVRHNHITYQAKWWTQGTEPGTTVWGPWREVFDYPATLPPTLIPVAIPPQVHTATSELLNEPIVLPTPAIAEDWRDNRIYLSGEIVNYQDQQWQAKWWTQGEPPSQSQWGPWKPLHL